MKKIAYLSALVLLLAACNDTKKQEKALQKEILDYHDKVMGDDEQAMIRKMKLDTIIHIADSLKAEHTEASKLQAQLVLADNKMSDWMKDFSLDYKDKSHDEIVNYLQAQKKTIKSIDSLLINATNAASQYLQKPEVR